MINIMNGRVLFGEYYTTINSFLINGGEEYPIYSIEDSDYFKLIDKSSYAAIQGEEWKDGGVWSNYFIEPNESFLIKFHIHHCTPVEEIKGQIYFLCSKENKYNKSYTTHIIDGKKEGDDFIFENKISALINGSCTYFPIKELNRRGVSYNESLCNYDIHKKLISEKNLKIVLDK